MADSLEGMSSETIAELAGLANSLANNPKTRETFLRMTKVVAPNTPIPEVDLLDRAASRFKASDDKLAKLEQQLLERDLRDRIESNRRGLREKGFTTSDVNAIEKMMVEKSIPSYDSAAEFYRLQTKQAEPTPSTFSTRTPNTLPVDGMKAIKQGQVGLNNWARGEAFKAIDDFKKQRAA